MKNRNVRRKNRKIKFSEEKYVENNYINDEGKAVIPLKLRCIEDLYMKHDYKMLELSDDVCSYIEEIAYMIPINTDIIIEIHCPKINAETKDKITKAIKNNYGIEIDDVDYEIDLQNKRSVILAYAAVGLFLISFLLEKYIGIFLSSFLNVIWWVAVWDLVEIQTLDKNENKWKRLNYQQLYDSQITFVDEE